MKRLALLTILLLITSLITIYCMPQQETSSDEDDLFGNTSSTSSTSSSTSSTSSSTTTEDTTSGIKIMAFNIEWLREPTNDTNRTDIDRQHIAQVIGTLSNFPEIMVFEEIESTTALEAVFQYFPAEYNNYNILIDPSCYGVQHIAVAYDANRVTVSSYRPMGELVDAVGTSFETTRVPFLVEFNASGYDGIIIGVHLKALFDSASVAKRRDEAQAIVNWINGYMSTASDKDVIILGDFNDYIGGTTGVMALFENDSNLNVVTDPADGFTDTKSTRDYNNVIDNIVISVDSQCEYVEHSAHIFNYDSYVSNPENVSDHYPVIGVFRPDC